MYTKPLKNTGLNVKAGKNERSIRTRIETLNPILFDVKHSR